MRFWDAASPPRPLPFCRNQRTVQEKTSEVLERYGLTQLVFQSAIKKFSEDDKFQAQIKEIENKQARRMKALADIGLAGAPLG